MNAANRTKTALPRNRILRGDVRDRLASLPDNSVDTVITSPPYVALRNYQVDGQIGATADVDQWIEDIRRVGRELARVLKPTGSWWLNLGDSYSRHASAGAPPKSLLLAPERLALALLQDGWVFRSRVSWAKSNPMPNSVKDRLACTWEVVYFLVRSRSYYFDLDAIRVPHRSAARKKHATRSVEVGKARSQRPPDWAGPLAGNNSGLARYKAQGLPGHPLGKNPGDVWSLPTANFRGQHFAVFPESLVRTPLLATCPEKVCAACGAPWVRERKDTRKGLAVLGGIRPACSCGSGTVPGVVLDPFIGSGTVGVVAEAHGRDWVGIELNPAFAQLADQRIRAARDGTQEPEQTIRTAA